MQEKPKRVLVADDSETMRMFIFFHLLKILPGVKLIEAQNGAEAVEKLNHGDVDLILTDMNMPVMDGLGLIRTVRTGLGKDTPIIVITTKGKQDERDRGIELGANGYITKPLNPREFRETILRVLSAEHLQKPTGCPD